MFSHILHSVPARPSPEDAAEEPLKGLQSDGATGGQRLAAPDCGVHAQPDPDHGRGQCPQVFLALIVCVDVIRFLSGALNGLRPAR